MIGNTESRTMNRLFQSKKGILLFQEGNGCYIDNGKTDINEIVMAKDFFIEFKENREDGAYFVYTDENGEEEVVKMLGIMGSVGRQPEDPNMYTQTLTLFKVKEASTIALDIDHNGIEIASKTFPKPNPGEEYKFVTELMTWFIAKYREYFKDLFPKE